jgi:hypothetical protein
MNKQTPAKQTAMNPNQIDTGVLGDLYEELSDVIAVVSVYGSIGVENGQPTVTGNEVSILMDVIIGQLRPIQTSLHQLCNFKA